LVLEIVISDFGNLEKETGYHVEALVGRRVYFAVTPVMRKKLFWCGVSLRNRFVCHVWVTVGEDGTNVQYSA
jgi:hypothetical protein